jgi:hypothetical protein
MILVNFNVVARPGPDVGARVPDPEGMLLWRSMHESSRGRIGIVYSGALDNVVPLEAWLKINQVKAAMYEVTGTKESKVCADKIGLIAASAGGRTMYFDTDPDTIAHTYSNGIPSMLVCQPYVVRPEWSSKRAIRGWDNLLEEIDKQVLAKSEKKWGDIE